MKKVTISAYENDRIDNKGSVVMELAKVLECSVSYLLEGNMAGMDCEEWIKILPKQILFVINLYIYGIIYL